METSACPGTPTQASIGQIALRAARVHGYPQSEHAEHVPDGCAEGATVLAGQGTVGSSLNSPQTGIATFIGCHEPPTVPGVAL